MIDTIKGALILLAASTLLINMGACQSKTPKAASEEQITADSGDQNGDRSATPSADADASPSDATEDNEIDLFGDHLVDWNELEKNDAVKFGKRQEVKGDLRPELWAEIEPQLPVSILKVAPDANVIESMEKSLKLQCSAPNAPQIASDQSTVQLVFCSKPQRPQQILNSSRDEVIKVQRGFFCNASFTPNPFNTEDPNEICDECPGLYADAVYLSLVSPKDHNARIYKLQEQLYFGLIHEECMEFSDRESYSIVDVKVAPFMGTTGLYVRTLDDFHLDAEHYGAGENHGSIVYTTWLFGGDKHRLVTHWTDTEFKYEWQYGTDESKCEENGWEEGCMEMTTEGSETYTETYMYYRNGAFTTETQSAKTLKELQNLKSKRPN